MNRARPVLVINSRLPVYKLTYGNEFGDTVTECFTRIAPKILPVGKELASKAIGIVGDAVIKDTGMYLYNLAKEKLSSLVKPKKSSKKSSDENSKEFSTQVVLLSTEEMPTEIADKINSLARKKLKTITGSGLKLSV